jgi:DNA repair exonuclease SbcCD ATPase subunit
MKLISANIRGAKGFYKGMHVDEVNIDFAQFNPGLIALVGEIGVGKTTLIDNLHFYNSLASRDGKLQDHFRLKNSHRIIKAEMNNKIYESRILIDALTGAAEAYLFEDNQPLNDGKLTTYKELVTYIFGSQRLFFNSRFSAQKTSGLAGLEVGDRRKLFFEILNYLRYEIHCKNAGTRRSKEEQKLAGIEGELRTLLEESQSITYTKPMIAEKIYNRQEKDKMILAGNVTLNVIKERLDKVKREVIKIETLKDQQAEIKKELDNVNKTIDGHNNKIEESQAQLKKEKDDKIKNFEADNSYDAEIKQLESDKKVSEEKQQLESAQINKNVEDIRKEILDINAVVEVEKVKIVRAEKIEGNKATIKEKLARKKEISTLLSELMLKDKSLSDEVNILKGEKDNQLKNVTTLENDTSLKEKSIKQLKDLNEKDEKRIEELKQEKLDKIAEVENETTILKDVPCDETLGATCPLISNTIDKKKNLDLALKTFDEKIESLLEITNKRLIDSIAFDKEVTDNKNKISTEKERIEIEFTPKVKDFESQLEKIGGEIKPLSAELVEINKHQWEELEIELKEATETKKIAQSVIENKKQMVQEKEKSKALLEENLKTVTDNLTEKLASINAQIESKRKLFAAERDAINKEYDSKIVNIKNNSSAQLNDLEKRKEDLSKKYDPEIATNYQIKIDEENKIIAEEKEAMEAIDLMKTEIANLDAEIKNMEEALVKKELNEDKIAEKNAGKALVTRDVTEYTLIEKALDKTGIPTLKLENSSYAITSLANELLAGFGNKFRVVFETLQMKADKKGMKEVFNINVIDDEDVCEIALKSGGEKVWIETALQLAISLYTGMQYEKKILTAYLDEKDGSLSEKSSADFLEMLRRVHHKSGVHHTLIISHRSSLFSMIPQQIIFTPDEGIKCITEEI